MFHEAELLPILGSPCRALPRGIWSGWANSRLRPHADRQDIDGGTIRMAAGVEIRTGRRSILGYLFSPLIEVRRSAFHER